MLDGQDNINKVLLDIHNVGYFDRHGGSFIFVIIVIVIITGFIYYSYFMENIDEIRKNWGAHRCVPMNMPLAGEVFPPTGDESKFSVIADNFNFCLNSALKAVVDMSMSPIKSGLMTIINVFKASADSLNSIQQGLNSIRSKMSSLAGSIFTKLYAMVIEFTRLSYKINDTFSKISGVFAASFQSIMTFYNTLQSFIGAFYQIIQMAAVFFIGLAITFMAVPFFAAWPAAIMMGSIATVLTTFMVVFSVATAPILDLSKYWIPTVPGFCFSSDTRLRMFDGTVKKMLDVKPGDVLHDGSIITSHLKMANKVNRLYRVNDNILVTGEHKMVVNGKFVSVKESGYEFKIEEYYGYLYCLNTDSKRIVIDEYVFSDYDELTDMEHSILLNTKNVSGTKDLWRTYEGGFHPDTSICMFGGSCKKISNIDVGDILRDNTRVLGVVNGIKRECIELSGVYDEQRNSIICSDNMLVSVGFYKDCVPLREIGNKMRNNTDVVYSQTINLLTSSQLIGIGCNRFGGFDKLTDFYLGIE